MGQKQSGEAPLYGANASWGFHQDNDCTGTRNRQIETKQHLGPKYESATAMFYIKCIEEIVRKQASRVLVLV
jgi:hypothetical protein